MAKKKKGKFVAWKPSKHAGEVVIDDIDEPANNAKAKKIERYYNSIRFPDLSEDRESWLASPTASQTSASREWNGRRIQKDHQGVRINVDVTVQNNLTEGSDIVLEVTIPSLPQKGNQSTCFELFSNGQPLLTVNLLIS